MFILQKIHYHPLCILLHLTLILFLEEKQTLFGDKWAYTEPIQSDPLPEDCLVLRRTGKTRALKWVSEKCARSAFYICEIGTHTFDIKPDVVYQIEGFATVIYLLEIHLVEPEDIYKRIFCIFVYFRKQHIN